MKTISLKSLLTRGVMFALIFISPLLVNATVEYIEEENCAEEDLAFQIYCPATVYLDCHDEIWDLSWLPNAYYHDYTGTHDAGTPYVKYHINDCNIGYIERTWKVADYHNVWHKCTQRIYVQGNYFNSSTIKWPKNIDLEGCNPPTEPHQLPSGFDMPTWSTYGASCSKIGYNYNDNVYVYGPGCYEIIRTWSLVDCCNFNPWTNTGIWTYNQRIKVTSTGEEPEVWVPYDVVEETYNCAKTYVDVPPLEVKDGCDEQYVITNNSPYASYGGADASGHYPVGTTKVRFMVKYNCWQTKFYYMNVTVTDKSTPVPYCYYGLAMPLMGVDTDEDGVVDDGMAEVWASDLDAGSYHPCHGDEYLKISFSSDPNDNVRVFTCEDVGEKEVNIWVTDYYGRQDYCTTYIDIQNNAANIPNCEPITEALISGKITSIYGNTEDMILDVNSTYEGMEFDTTYTVEEAVTIVDTIVDSDGTISYEYGISEVSTPDVDTTHVDKDFQTEVEEGEYMLENLDLNEDYTLTIFQEAKTDYIDEMDVKMLELYLAGQVEMTMYQKMAADLNHDLMVDAADMEILSKFVNGEITAEEIDISWVTYDPDFEMNLAGSTDLEVYPVSKTIEINNRNATEVDIMVFQMGDLTDAEDLEGILGPELAIRDINAFVIESVSPNPFNNLTTITVHNNANQDVRLEVFDLSGKRLINVNRTLEVGTNALSVNATELGGAGIYLYKVSTDTQSLQGKLILID